jgi:branched-subunit amino acid aminotransferase/4-amino-4-deoxychorismate lyase
VSDATKGWLFEGGRWTDATSLPLTDRATRYGMAVFATIGVRDGTAQLLEKHTQLLSASAKNLLGVDFRFITPPLDSADRGMLRVYVTGGDGGPADPVREPRIFALFESLSDNLPDFQTARLHADSVTPFAHGAKTGNYWAQCTAQAGVRAGGFDHALLRDAGGRLLSGAMGNVFFVHKGTLCTPSLSLAVRPGVIRSWVMEQQPVQEVEFSADRLEEAAEIFLTNSRLGVMPLKIAGIGPGPVGCALRDRCRREKIIP